MGTIRFVATGPAAQNVGKFGTGKCCGVHTLRGGFVPQAVITETAVPADVVRTAHEVGFSGADAAVVAAAGAVCAAEGTVLAKAVVSAAVACALSGTLYSGAILAAVVAFAQIGTLYSGAALTAICGVA